MRIRGRQISWRSIAFGAAAIGLLVGLCLLAYHLFTGEQTVPRKIVPNVVQLKIVQPPPPPPPPPPKMIEQPKVTEQEIRTEQPQPDKPPAPDKPSDEPPAPGPLSLDAKGEGPPDAFALGGKPGGSDFLGGGGGGGGSKFGWYAAMIQNRARDALQKQRRLMGSEYEVAVLVWLRDDGSPDRVELVESTGDAEIDRMVVQTLEQMPRLPQAPPPDMPQPVLLWVSSV